MAKCCGDCVPALAANGKEKCVAPNIQPLIKKHTMLNEKLKLNSQRIQNIKTGKGKSSSDDLESATTQQKEIQDAINKTLNDIQVLEKQNQAQTRYDCVCRKK